ncbi:ATP-binding cassette domain-containing protein [Mucilaginibacter antarcticus]|uniref:ATP-binding cassette domain-containing protein n=1 Tax=Mucilaginibacter antarcticus TaxID=1855725 RepID=A0ABW5XJE4_9SPHI
MIDIDIQKSLTVYHGKKTLQVRHRFETGTITKIFGPSGAGKTTLLKVIAGLAQPEKGRIVAGDDIWLDTENRINLLPQKRMPGFVFQDFALFPNMTVLQHLQYATNDVAWINRLLKLGRLETLNDHKPQHLSGGQQQRLAVLRALTTKPKLILMDEPFSAIDPDLKTALIADLKVVFNELKATVLIVSHNPSELEGLVNGELLIKE